MANQTIYPFGTDGTLPSGIGVINDLTTGGVEAALSAEMGKRVAGRETTDRARIDAIVAILKKSVFTDDQSTAIAALDALANATDSISIDKTSYLFNGVGGTMTLTAYTDPASKPVTWSSSDTSVATVNDGVVTAIAVGTATITATSGDKSVTCAIQVQAFQVDSVILNQNTLTSSGEVVGAIHQLSATTSPAGGAIIWSSNDDSVATVDQTGLVTIVGNGSCTITATSGTESDTCSVTVANVKQVYTVSVGTLTNVTLAMVDGNNDSVGNGDTIVEGSSLTITLTPAASNVINSLSITMGATDLSNSVTDSSGVKTLTIASVNGNISVSASASYQRTNLLSGVTKFKGASISNNVGEYSYSASGAGYGKIVELALGKRYFLKNVVNSKLRMGLVTAFNENSNGAVTSVTWLNAPAGSGATSTDMDADVFTAFKSQNILAYAKRYQPGSVVFPLLDFKTPTALIDTTKKLYLIICADGSNDNDASTQIDDLELYEWLPADGTFSMVNASDIETSRCCTYISNSTGALEFDISYNYVAGFIKLEAGKTYEYAHYNDANNDYFGCFKLVKSSNNGYTFSSLASISGYTFIGSSATYKANMKSASGEFTTPTTSQFDYTSADIYLMFNIWRNKGQSSEVIYAGNDFTFGPKTTE